MAIFEFHVTESQQMINAGVNITDMHAVFYSIQAQLIGPADCLSPFDAASGQPHCKAVVVVVAAIAVF